MKRRIQWMASCLLGGAALLLGTSCITDKTVETEYINVPQLAVWEQGPEKEAFALNACKGIFCVKGDSLLMEQAKWFSAAIRQATGINLPVGLDTGDAERKIRLDIDAGLTAEAFQINVTAKEVQVKASNAAGAFYGMQFLVQSLILQDGSDFRWAACKVEDFPEFHYRGAMLDVSRNFFSVAQVKGFIDMMATHRLNYFHWHLTDDQGWRIEIKKYPELTQKGAWRGTQANRQGGFYTQEEIRDVIRYAALRGISIIPEIDLPGHSTAALAACPWMGCTGGPYEVATVRGGVHKDVLCLGNKKTYQFVKDVLSEVAALFPAPYIHIGGDEVPRDRWERCGKCQKEIARLGLKDIKGHSAEDLLQGEFNRQMAAYVKTLGKNLVGWDEVLSDNIDKETVIMSWRGLGRGVKALQAGHPVIFSSNGHFYLNNYQSEEMDKEPAGTGGLVEMKKVYEADWNTGELDAAEQDRILGVEACLWTSFVENTSIMEYMLLPRLAAFSEVAWNGHRRKGYADFLNRLPQMLRLYGKMGWRSASHYYKIESTWRSDMEKKELEVVLTTIPGAEIFYTLDGEAPSRKSLKYQKPILIAHDARLSAVAYLPSGLVSDTLYSEVNINKATFCPIILHSAPAYRYEGDGGKVLVDGVRSKTFHTTGMWVGYYENPMETVIDLRKVQQVSKATVSSLIDMGAYIMGIQELNIESSVDGVHFRQLASRSFAEPPVRMEGKKRVDLEMEFPVADARWIKVRAKGFKALPEWHSGAGKQPFFFIDEIEID